MFNTLIESKPKKRRTVGGTVFSVAFHATIIFFAVYATANARVAEDERSRQESLKFVEVKAEEPKPEPERPEPEPPPQREPVRPTPTPPAPRIEAPAPIRGFQTLQAPVTVPVSIPQVDLSARITSEADFSGRGAAGGTASGSAGGAAGGTGTGVSVDAGRQTFYEYEVERTASRTGGPEPVYPIALRQAGVEGQVVVEFVVTETGRVDMSTVKVIESANSQFTASVRTALAGARFSPARVSGRNVRQYVRQPFTFRLERS
jgi:protein TonB